MNEKEAKQLSKFLSLVLRHEPQKVGLSLDAAGWVGVDELLSALSAHGKIVTRAQLDFVVANNDKRRFAFSEDGERIRAQQGHSVEVNYEYEPIVPPATLYHGTATRVLDTIRIEGLRRMSRSHVHLSGDYDTAVKVGMRHGKPVVLRVDSGRMHAAGFAFFRTPNQVWLVDAVPPQFLTEANAPPESPTTRSM
ncbi:MAG TPA: RNA 2'-phosphotransferase [Phycisphaerae bacterium]|nr:RNA 2'-phosphotransferase [Phycisphaerae bacterium]HRW55872.1 RNA 2'-phosphotransferase [Phycisphaerae bacterium]